MPKSKTHNRIEDTAHYAGYLVADHYPGGEIHKEIERKHGVKAAAWFNLAVKAYVGAILYSQGNPSDTSRAAAESVERSSREVGLQTEVWGDVVAALRNSDVPISELDSRIAKMHDRIESMLKASLKK